MIDDEAERMTKGEPPATYIADTGEMVYSEKPEHAEAVACLKRTLDSEPE